MHEKKVVSTATDTPDNPLDIAPGDRLRIHPKEHQLSDVVEEALYAVCRKNVPPRIFVRGGKLSRVRQDEHGQPLVEIMNVAQVRHLISKVAFWEVLLKNGPRPIPPPREVGESIVGLESYPDFSPLRGITETPILHEDGSLHATPGYDAKTQLFYQPRESLSIELPESVTGSDIALAFDTLDDVLGDFPFLEDGVVNGTKTPASLTHCYAIVLTVVVRNLISGPVPAAILNKPAPGTGASLLCDLIATIATGEPAQISSYPSREEEIEKLLTSFLIKGHPLIVFDNIDRPIESASLSSFLTSRVWKMRLLGRSEALTLPNNAVVLLNGNNVSLRGDIGRRSFASRLDAKCARPWQGRTFRHPHLLEYAKEHRAEILRAAYVIGKSWLQAGRPKPAEDKLLGGFESWSHTIGGMLHHAGVPGFLDNLGELYEQIDEEAAEWEAFLTRILESFGGRDTGFTVADLNEEIRSSRGKTDALIDLLPGNLADEVNATGFTRRLGRALLRKRETRFGSIGVRVERLAGAHRVARWRVVTDKPKVEP